MTLESIYKLNQLSLLIFFFIWNFDQVRSRDYSCKGREDLIQSGLQREANNLCFKCH